MSLAFRTTSALLLSCLLAACSGGSTSTGTAGTGAGGGGTTSTTGMGGGDAGVSDAGDAGDAGPCVEPTKPPAGQSGPAQCGCAEEARAYLPAIAAAALVIHGDGGALCGQALPTPTNFFSIAGQQYTPSNDPGFDFQTGDMSAGWLCLGFAPPGSVHCAYSYNVGAGYVGPGLGGPDPGASGFEVVAQGDVDADNIPSTFTLAAFFKQSTGTFELQPIFEHQPDE